LITTRVVKKMPITHSSKPIAWKLEF